MKKGIKFRRQFDLGYNGTPVEKDYGESLTVPSMTLTVKELMERHTRGIGTGAAVREGIYLDDQEIPVITDLTDLQERREELEQQGKDLTEKVNEEIIAKRDKEKSDKKDTTETENRTDSPPRS